MLIKLQIKFKILFQDNFLSKSHFVLIEKCFGVCGCGSGNTCKYCNSDYYIGYDRQNKKSLNYKTPTPFTNGNTCSINTEYVDVIFKN